MPQKAFIVTMLPLLAIITGCASGASEAQQDIKRGRLELRGYGLPVPWVPTYAHLLKERLGVEYKSVAGCVVTERLVERTDAYNHVMEAEIERRFGADALAKLREEARSTRPATRPAA